MNRKTVESCPETHQKRLARVLVCVIIAFLAPSCGTLHYEQLGDSGKSAPTDAAKLTNPWDKVFGSTIHLHKVDGNTAKDYGKSDWMTIKKSFNSWFNGKFEISLSPGRHILQVSYPVAYRRQSAGGARSVVWPKELSFFAHPGHTYLIEAVLEGEKTTWRPVITDVTDSTRPQPVKIE